LSCLLAKVFAFELPELLLVLGELEEKFFDFLVTGGEEKSSPIFFLLTLLALVEAPDHLIDEVDVDADNDDDDAPPAALSSPHFLHIPPSSSP